MEQLKKWVMEHKALAAGGAIALGLLLYLWLSSARAPAQQGGSSDQALAAYYGAQGASLQGAAAQAQSEDARLVASGQTAAAERVALAQIAAAKIPYMAQLEALSSQLNLVAYQDYLAEQRGAGGLSPTPAVGSMVEGGTIWNSSPNTIGTQTLWSGGSGTSPLIERNPITGEISVNRQLPGHWTEVPSGGSQLVVWSGIPGETPTPWVAPPKPATLQWKDFVAAHGVQLGLAN